MDMLSTFVYLYLVLAVPNVSTDAALNAVSPRIIEEIWQVC